MTDLTDFQRRVYEPEVRALRARIKGLNEQLEAAQAETRTEWQRAEGLRFELSALQEQLEIARKALAFFDPDDDADAAIAFARRLNPEWDSASAPVDGHPCKGQGAEYLVEQDNSNPAKERDPALCRHGYDLTQEAECPLCKAQEALSEWEPARWCRRCGVYGCEHVLPAQSPASEPHVSEADAPVLGRVDSPSESTASETRDSKWDLCDLHGAYQGASCPECVSASRCSTCGLPGPEKCWCGEVKS